MWYLYLKLKCFLTRRLVCGIYLGTGGRPSLQVHLRTEGIMVLPDLQLSDSIKEIFCKKVSFKYNLLLLFLTGKTILLSTF